MLLAFTLPALLLGLLFGSFLNVIISRVPGRESIMSPRSHCRECRAAIRWYDNIPLFSWLFLRARCRDCGSPISIRYPLVELATGLWFFAVVAAAAASRFTRMHGFASGSFGYADVALGETTIALATLGLLLIPLVVIDWQQQLLPDALTLPGIALGFLFVCSQAIFLPAGANDLHFNPRNSLRLRSPGSFIARGDVFLTGTERLVFGRLAAVLLVVLVLLAIRSVYRKLRHREGMGLGDVKLLAMIAAFLGLWPAILALFLGVLLGTIYALTLVFRRHANAATRVPFGSFLGAGGLLSALIGPQVITWYQSLL